MPFEHLTVSRSGQLEPIVGHPVSVVNLYDAGDYEVTLQAADHYTQ